MKLSDDLTSPWLIHAKGFLFVILGLFAATLLWIQLPTFRTVCLLGITIWSFCRFYYYLFYVLERYLGKEQPFAGIGDALKHLLFRGRKRKP